jgi:hypothetical protein
MNETFLPIEAATQTSEEGRVLAAFSLGRLLSRVATALFALFLLLVVADSLPVRFLDPAWHLRFSGSLIRNGLLAVLGILMVPLAAVIDSSSRSLARYRDRLRRWSILVALGYLLLIPLQGYGVWKGLSTLRSAKAMQFERAHKKFAEVRKAINSASSADDLQARFSALRGPTLPPDALKQPLPELRQRLLVGLEGAENQMRNQLVGSPPVNNIQSLILQATRVAMSSLILAFAFAAAAHRRGSPSPLIEEWTKAWKQLSLKRLNRAQMRKL